MLRPMAAPLPQGSARPPGGTARKSRTGLIVGSVLIAALAIGGAAVGTGMVHVPGFGSAPVATAVNPAGVENDRGTIGDIGGVHYIGVFMKNLNLALVQKYNLDGHRTEGVLVIGIYNASPAEAAGLKVNDIIVAVDDIPVSNFDEVQAKIRLTAIGDSFRVTVDRNGALLSTPVRVGRCDETCRLEGQRFREMNAVR